MITINLKSRITIFILGFLLGCFVTLLLTGGCNKSKVATGNIVQPKELQKQADEIEKTYQERLTELESKNQTLQQELKGAKDQLSAIKTKTKQKEATIKKIIEPKGFPAKELLKKVNSSSLTIDSSLSPCDSLVQEVSEYMQENEVKDSLYELQVSTQENIIITKDSVIGLQSKQHDELQTLFGQSLATQETLTKENVQLRRQFKRQKFRNRLLSIGVTILSGITANYLIHH